MLKAFSILHIPPNGVEVTDGEVVSMRTSTGGDAHVGHAVVSGDPAAIQGVNLQDATTCFVDQNDPVVIKSSDGNTTLATSPAAVIAGALDSVRLGGNYAVFNTGGASISVNQFDGSGSFAANYAIAANQASFTLANATTRIAVDLGPIQVTAGSKTVNANIAINQGAWQPFPLGASTDAIVSNGDAIEIENQGDSQGVNGTVLVAAGVAKARLPASASMVANGVAIQVPVTGTYVDTITPTVSAAGVITAFVLS